MKEGCFANYTTKKMLTLAQNNKFGLFFAYLDPIL